MSREGREGVERLETRTGMGSGGGVQGRGMGGGGKCVLAFIYWGWKRLGGGERESAAEKFFYYFNVLWLIWDKKKML